MPRASCPRRRWRAARPDSSNTTRTGPGSGTLEPSVSSPGHDGDGEVEDEPGLADLLRPLDRGEALVHDQTSTRNGVGPGSGSARRSAADSYPAAPVVGSSARASTSRTRVFALRPPSRFSCRAAMSADSRSRMRALDTAEIAKLLDATDDPGFRTLLALSIALGLRQSEALGLRWSDIDLGASLLRVRHQLDRDGKLVAPKTEQAKREIVLGPRSWRCSGSTSSGRSARSRPTSPSATDPPRTSASCGSSPLPLSGPGCTGKVRPSCAGTTCATRRCQCWSRRAGHRVHQPDARALEPVDHAQRVRAPVRPRAARRPGAGHDGRRDRGDAVSELDAYMESARHEGPALTACRGRWSGGEPLARRRSKVEPGKALARTDRHPEGRGGAGDEALVRSSCPFRSARPIVLAFWFIP